MANPHVRIKGLQDEKVKKIIKRTLVIKKKEKKRKN